MEDKNYYKTIYDLFMDKENNIIYQFGNNILSSCILDDLDALNRIDKERYYYLWHKEEKLYILAYRDKNYDYNILYIDNNFSSVNIFLGSYARGMLRAEKVIKN